MAGLRLVGSLAAAALIIGTNAAWSAAPDELETTAPAAPSLSGTPIEEYALDAELIVKDWVLCVSQPLAETLVKAREQSIADAVRAYEELKAARSCGQFAELRVILREPLYVSAEASGYDARIFGALVNIAGGWANAFVVSGAVEGQ